MFENAGGEARSVAPRAVRESDLARTTRREVRSAERGIDRYCVYIRAGVVEMKGHNPQAQGMKWFARVKRAAKREKEEKSAWGERDDGDDDDNDDVGKPNASSSTHAAPKVARAVVNPLAVDERLAKSRTREVKLKGKKRKRTSYAVDKVDLQRAGALPKKKRTSTTSVTDVARPKYAHGNPFAALARRQPS
mmetsp:Transcript_5454/g.18360  ORF Transcript_5454/g.18360 Transcript_5454/m.18360 type:complete len:192 (+) Transcript_5454:298-873(+)